MWPPLWLWRWLPPVSHCPSGYVYPDDHTQLSPPGGLLISNPLEGGGGRCLIETGRVFERGAYQEPITWSEQLPRPLVTAFSRTILFLERFWRKFRISFKSHKPVSKTYRPENDNLFLFNDATFSFMISYISIAFIDAAEIPFSREKLP